MEPYWDLFYQTGDPKAYVLYSSQKLEGTTSDGTVPEQPSGGEEEFLWRQHPIL